MWDWIADKWAKHGNTILTVAAATVAFVAVTAVTGGLGAPAAAALILGGAASGATGYVVGQKLAGRPIEAKQVVIQATIGAAVTVATAGLGRVATPLFSRLLGAGAQQAAAEGARTGIRAIAAETAAHSLAGGATGGTVKVVENAVTGKKLTDGVLEAAAIGAAQGALARPTKALDAKIRTTTAGLKARVAARVRPSSKSLASGTARQLDSALGEEPSAAPKGEELAPGSTDETRPSKGSPASVAELPPVEKHPLYEEHFPKDKPELTGAQPAADVALAEPRGPPQKGLAQALDPSAPLGQSRYVAGGSCDKAMRDLLKKFHDLGVSAKAMHLINKARDHFFVRYLNAKGQIVHADPSLRGNLKGYGVPESKCPPEGQVEFTPEEHAKYLDLFPGKGESQLRLKADADYDFFVTETK